MAVRGLSLTGAIVAVSVGVLLPVVLSTSVGIIAIATEKSTKELVMGVLIVSFTCAAIGGAVVPIDPLAEDYFANLAAMAETIHKALAGPAGQAPPAAAAPSGGS